MNEMIHKQKTKNLLENQLSAAQPSAGATLVGAILSGFGNILITAGTFLKQKAAQTQAEKLNSQRHIDVIQLS